MFKESTLFIIDPQNDFIDAPGKAGSLAVNGAYNDMLRLSEVIKNNSFDQIVVSLDTHSTRDIAHKEWWVNQNGEQPEAFTLITYDDFLKGKWKPAKSSDNEMTEFYLKSLAEKGKKTLVVWPDHCIKNTWGHEVMSELMQALKEWEVKTGNNVEYVKKGENPNTEHYSAIKAEVVLDDYSDVNHKLVDKMASSFNVYVAGEAKSHCVADSVIDLVNALKERDRACTINVLEDCMSPVGGFEKTAEDFIEWCKQNNVNIMKSEDMLKNHTSKVKRKP